MFHSKTGASILKYYIFAPFSISNGACRSYRNYLVLFSILDLSGLHFCRMEADSFSMVKESKERGVCFCASSNFNST